MSLYGNATILRSCTQVFEGLFPDNHVFTLPLTHKIKSPAVTGLEFEFCEFKESSRLHQTLFCPLQRGVHLQLALAEI